MHPAEAMAHGWDFEWDDGNQEKIARHRITPDEVEQVYYNDDPLSRWGRDKRGQSGDYLMVGYTLGGRLLTIVIEMKPESEKLRVITGWSSSSGERSRFWGK